MKFADALNSLIKYFSAYDVFIVGKDEKSLNLPESSLISFDDNAKTRNMAMIKTCLDFLVSKDIVHKQQINGEDVYVNITTLNGKTQTVEIGFTLASAIAKVINGPKSEDEPKTDPLKLTEMDIAQLIKIIYGKDDEN